MYVYCLPTSTSYILYIRTEPPSCSSASAFQREVVFWGKKPRALSTAQINCPNPTSSASAFTVWTGFSNWSAHPRRTRNAETATAQWMSDHKIEWILVEDGPKVVMSRMTNPVALSQKVKITLQPTGEDQTIIIITNNWHLCVLLGEPVGICWTEMCPSYPHSHV